MGATWSQRIGIAIGLLGLALPATGDELPPLPPPRTPPAAVEAVVAPTRAGAAPARPQTPAGQPAAPTPVAARSDAAAVRAETGERLKKVPADADRAATAATKALRAVLEERLARLDAWDKAVKDRQAAENPTPSPEKQAAEWKAELERIKAVLDQAARNPDWLLPVSFRGAPAPTTDAARTEMKDAIDAAQADLKDWSGRLELYRSDPARKPGGSLASARAGRDKTFQQVASLKARNLDRAAASAELKNPEARALAREKLLNDQWEARVELERLRGQEALLALESRRSELAGLNQAVLEAHVLLARRTLDRMTLSYRALAARQEHDLHQAAAQEQTRSEKSDDPVERYRAKRASEILELEARVLTGENALTTNPPPALEDQRALADRAETDFTNIKHLLDDGRVSHLDALRLSNDFRRIGPERSRIIRHELAVTADRLSSAENALSAVELELINDSRDDRFELDNLLERLPGALHPKAVAVFEDFERKHQELLIRRRAALEKLASRAEQTHDQVLRRLRVLDDHFGFIRTHLFWVRDEGPVGLATLGQAQRETRQLARASLRIAEEVADPSAWGRLSPEFLAATFGLLVLPWPMHRLRRKLRPPCALAPGSATNPDA